ncbi:hypothetical protein FF38_13751 [Lucilia cuprina]|uniref:ZP domain-containing protein n=1 Tax=Lucilia cuprina TaxID=7375 RepID=A0A0L0BSC8_LUCCU|nr:hypothetical protein FF38_13751 [Lucilia cuprina]
MRVYSTNLNNYFRKSAKNNTNLMHFKQQKKHHDIVHHHDDREPWSLPIKHSYFFAFVFVTLFMQHYVIIATATNDATKFNSGSLLDGGITKGFRNRMRSPKISSVHNVQVVGKSLPKNRVAVEPTVADDNQTNIIAPAAGKFEIHSVSGEPNYKYVNLTWEVEFVGTDDADAITNSSAEVEPPSSFQVFFCEIQSFGPHRCRSKVVNGSTSLQMYDNTDNDLEVVDKIRQVRQYMTQVDNLRMATKYSFHIRSLPKHKNMKVTGRSEIFNNEIEGEDFLSNNMVQGQTIVVPTKGSQATRCLPTASEIEVETGPYFGGKIVVDGGNCGIKGDPNDAKDKYVMRIDHKACGSMVKPETNTVETFITVQENLGIFTHSTRSYQSGLQTVRASFSVPGRGGASAVQQDHYDEEERMGRGLKPMRYVDKSELVLKETTENNRVGASEETQAMVEEMDNPTINYNNSLHDDNDDASLVTTDDDQTNAVATLENIIPGINEEHIKHQQQTEVNENEEQNKVQDEESELKHSIEYNEGSGVAATTNVNDDANDDIEDEEADVAAANVVDIEAKHDQQQFSAKFAKLTLDRNENAQVDEDDSDDDFGATPTGRGFGWFGSGFELISLNMGSVMLTVLLSVILIGIFIYVLYRETNLPPPITSASSSTSLNASNRHHHHHHHHQHLHEVDDTLPRTLRTKNQDLLA